MSEGKDPSTAATAKPPCPHTFVTTIRMLHGAKRDECNACGKIVREKKAERYGSISEQRAEQIKAERMLNPRK